MLAVILCFFSWISGFDVHCPARDCEAVCREWALRDKMPIREIARRTGLSSITIKKYLRAGIVEPQFQTQVRPSSASRARTGAPPSRLSCHCLWQCTDGRWMLFFAPARVPCRRGRVGPWDPQ